MGGRRRWDLNPRRLFTLHDFQSCSLDHYETPPGVLHALQAVAARAERVGFEPTRACTLPLFESGTFDHSDISPCRSIAYLLQDGKHYSSRIFPHFLTWILSSHATCLFFVDFLLLVEPASEVHSIVVGHALAHLGIVIEMVAQLKQFLGLFPGETGLQQIIQQQLLFREMGRRSLYAG